MAAASVLIPFSAISQGGGTLPPSALVQHSSRHGRSRAASMKGKNRYNVLENRDVAVAKAVSFVLKRATREADVEEESEEDEDEEAANDRLISNNEGWVPVTDLLRHSRISDLHTTLPDLLRISSTSKARFELRQRPNSDAEVAASYQIRSTHKRDSLQEPIPEGAPLTTETEDLPEFLVYETSYEAYPHILASGSIQRAAGATHSTWTPADSRPNGKAAEADIGIWVHVRTALETQSGISWQRTASGNVVTADEVPRSLWKKAIARRTDVGLLLEDGEVRKEVPEALRGKGSKGKAKKGKGSLRPKSRGGDEASDSASDE